MISPDKLFLINPALFIKNIAENIYYRFHTSFHFNDRYNDQVDTVFKRIIKCFENDIDNVDIEFFSHTITIRYKNMEISDIWNANKYYSWLSRGNYKKDDKTIFTWSSDRPSAKTMYMFNKQLNRKLQHLIDEV